MTLRPIGNRILVKPIANEDTTESGLVLVEHRKPETMGEVIAVGPCAHPLRAEAEDLADRLETTLTTNADLWLYCEDAENDALQLQKDAASMLRDVTRKTPLVNVGDTVVFSWRAGREVQIDDTGDRYLMLTEDQIDAVLENV